MNNLNEKINLLISQLSLKNNLTPRDSVGSNAKLKNSICPNKSVTFNLEKKTGGGIEKNYYKLGTGPFTKETKCLSEKKNTYYKGKEGEYWKHKEKPNFMCFGICDSCKKKKSCFVKGADVPASLKSKIK